MGSGVDGVRTATSTERWWLLETFQYLPLPHRARLIERLQIDRHACLMSTANAPPARSKPASSSSSSAGPSAEESSESSSRPVKEAGVGSSSESPSQSQGKGNGPITSFSWKENNDDADLMLPCPVPTIYDLEESTLITQRPYFVPVVVGAGGTSTQKQRKGGGAYASSSTINTTGGRAGSGKAGHLSAATIARAAAIATALDYSDYSCLIHAGLYSSSLVPIDKRQSKRDIAKDKSLIFSRWAASVDPAPLRDSSRRGNHTTMTMTTTITHFS